MPTMDVAERRRRAKIEYDAYLAACPSRQLLDRIGDKWVVLVVCALRDGPQRYSELRRRLAGVSEKMLTQTLRSLERDGLLDRAVTAGVPPRVDYTLTDLGRSLLTPIEVLKSWAETNMECVHAAREAYDLGGGSTADPRL